MILNVKLSNDGEYKVYFRLAQKRLATLVKITKNILVSFRHAENSTLVTVTFSIGILRHGIIYVCLTFKFVTFALLSSVGIVMQLNFLFSEIIRTNLYV